VDLCIVGADRVTANGDVANKIGTYLKALAAQDNRLPFYVAFPSSTIDWTLTSGDAVPIEERAPEEVTTMTGRLADGRIETIALTPKGTPAQNPAFDVTPARLVTSFITERGICPATSLGLSHLFHGSRAGERQTQ
jgi:methylthioribose-1-phosphate isomerase